MALLHTQHRCFSRLDDAWRAEFGDDVKLPHWADLLKSGIAIFDLDFDAILSTIYALSISAEGDCCRCVPPDPGIAAAALGASESGTLPGTAPTEALHTFTFTFTLVTTTTLGGQRVSIRMCTRTGRHLATFTRRPGSSLYTLATAPSQVAASAQVSATGQVTASCSCRLLLHQTLLWNHRLGHPSLPRLRGMHSRLLVSGLLRSLPPLPPSPTPPCLPCVEGRQCAAPHSYSFPPTTAPLQILHMDVWGPARVSGQDRECYFLLVVDDCTRYTTVFPLRNKGQVVDVLIPWIRTVRLHLRERFGQDLPILRLHSDRGGEFSSNLLRDFCRAEGILQSFTLPDSPQQNGISERCIGVVVEVARTSMIHAAAPHFLWPFAVRYAAHQLNLWPRVSLPETSPTLRWTGEVGDASVFRVWGSRAFVRDTLVDKLSARAIPCDATFDESVPFYILFPYRSTPPPPPPLFLAPGPPPVDPLPPKGPAPLGVSQVDPLPGPALVQVDVDSGAVRGVESEGAEPGGAESEGAETWGVEPGGAELGRAATGSGEPGGATSEGAESRDCLCSSCVSVRRTRLRSGASGARGADAAGAGGTGVAAGAGVPGGTATTGPGGARTRGTRDAGTGGVEGAGFGDLTESGPTGAGGAGARGAGVGGPGAGGAGVGGAGAGGAGAVDLGGPLASQLTAPSPYTEHPGGLTEHREHASRPVSPVRTARRVPHSCPPPVPRMHAMALCRSSVPLRVPLLAPLESSLPEVPDLESDRARTASPTVSRLLATAVTDPSFESTSASALVAELLGFAAACCLDYASALVAESAPASPTSVGGECALDKDVLEDRQEDLESLAAAVPRFASILLAPEGDPDAPDIPTPRSYAEAITGPYSSQQQAAMDAEKASWKHRKVHWDAAKRVLRYLCSTSGMGLVLGGRGPVVLTGDADTSWVDDSAKQQSSQGYTCSLGATLAHLLLTDLGEQPRSPPVLYVDNKAMIALCQEHRTKHIALRYFLARELQQRGQLRLAYVAIRANTADVFTKALPLSDHQRFVTVLGLVPTLPHLLIA
ncbi:unnamed protein product [Closterium sp. NIES-54]